MRQLAAILFADMTGYTALMQDNEHLARQKRKRFKKCWKLPLQNHDGKDLTELWRWFTQHFQQCY
jgi:class 3 adenylate cyclase